MIKEIHIYDIDGTLVDSSHRYRYIIGADGWRKINFPFWVANRHRAHADKLLPLAKQYREQRADSSVFTVLATARNMHSAEWQHIKSVLGMPDFFISRDGETDTRSGAALKIDGLRELFRRHPKLATVPGFFYEDNTAYLNAVCDEFGFKGFYYASKQGY